ncbi:MAG: hypothetical protein K0S34_1758 [Bacillales bacterium]|jgi:uncharacterized membrane protein|nr:hypothetical protein [Bacillales bacterium]
MDKKLRHELETLTKEKLITEEQFTNIIDYYRKRDNKSPDWYLSTLPWLAAILLIFGLFSFVAANWSVMENFAKLSLLIGALIISTELGRYFANRNKALFSNVLFVISATIFGSSLILTAQMYHLVSYSATVFFIWSLGIFLYYLILNNYIFFIYSVLVSMVGLFYSNNQNYDFPYIFICVMTLLFAYYAFKLKDLIINYLTVIFIVLSWSIFLPSTIYSNNGYFLNDLLSYVIPCLVPTILLSLGLYLEKKDVSYKTLVNVPLFLAVVFWSIQSIDTYRGIDYNLEALITHYIAFIIIIAGTILLIGIEEFRTNIEKYILFIPLFYFIPDTNTAEFIPLLVLLTYSISLLVKGYKSLRQNTFKNGTIIFLLTVVLFYFQVSYTFLSKSLFFFSLSIIVLIVYATLQWLMKEGRGAKNDKK